MKQSVIKKQPSQEACQWMFSFFARTSIPRMDEEKKNDLLRRKAE